MNLHGSQNILSLVIVIMSLSVGFAMECDHSNGIAYAKKYGPNPNKNFENYCRDISGREGDCSNFVSQILLECFGQPFCWEPGYSYEEWTNWDKYHSKCKKPEIWKDLKNCLPDANNLRNWLKNKLGCPLSNPINRNNPPSDLKPGDIAFYCDSNGVVKHVVYIIDIIGNLIIYAGHCEDNERYPLVEHNTNEGNLLSMYPNRQLKIMRMPNQVLGCAGPPKAHNSIDSSFGQTMTVCHEAICCWHENLGGTWPWYSDSTAYACLSWDENRGTTWDTLISPRMNLAGCSSVVFRQSSYSNLLRGSNKVIKIMGSTNDGASWSDSIGTDTTTEASLPWASNQRNVRIAWIYFRPKMDL
jgi:hypothetical protein